MSWFSKKKKLSREDLREYGDKLIAQIYGGLSFGDEIKDNDKEYLFICIQQGNAIIYDAEKKEIRHINADLDKLRDGLDTGVISIE